MRLTRLLLLGTMLFVLAGANVVLVQAVPPDCFSGCGMGGKVETYTYPFNCSGYDECFVTVCDSSCDGDDYLHQWCSPHFACFGGIGQ